MRVIIEEKRICEPQNLRPKAQTTKSALIHLEDFFARFYLVYRLKYRFFIFYTIL